MEPIDCLRLLHEELGLFLEPYGEPVVHVEQFYIGELNVGHGVEDYIGMVEREEERIPGIAFPH